MTRPHHSQRPTRWMDVRIASLCALLGMGMLTLLLLAATPSRAQSITTAYLPLIVRTGEPAIELGTAQPRLPANGVSTTTITATVRDGSGMPQAGVPVRLSTTLGSFANQDTVLQQTTDAQGTIRTTLQSVLASTADVLTITAEAQFDAQPLRDTAQISLLVPERISVSSLPLTVTADIRSQSLLVVQVQDRSGAPMPNYPLLLSTTPGQFAGGQSFIEATTGATGRASVPWYAAPSLGAAQVLVQAGKVQGSTAVQLVPATCNDFEDNDVPNQANEQFSALCMGSFQDDEIIDEDEGEDDYYIVTLDPQQAVRVELSGIPAGADYDVILYNARLENVAFSNLQGQQDEQLSYTHQGTERQFYYLRLNMYRKSDTAENTYQLMVRLNPLEQPGSVPVQRSLPLATNNDPPLPAKYAP